MVSRHVYVNGGSQVRRVLVLAQCISKVLEVWRLFKLVKGLHMCIARNMGRHF